MKIYLAGPWKRRSEVRDVRKILQDAGFQVTSRWLDAPDFSQTDAKQMQTEAQHDIEDILSSDKVIVMNLEISEGKSVEQGIAYCHNIPIIVVGKPSNVFQYLSTGFSRVNTLQEAIVEAQHA